MSHVPDNQKRASGASQRILVVEDNEDARELMRALIEKMGHEVRTAMDGASAIELAREFKPALVLLDIGLPQMDGYSLARKLREEHGTELVLAALTGYGQERDRRLSHDAGINHHLVKPVGLDAVREIIAALPAPPTPAS
ncbi:MAG TPA: response regulator [Polyangiaceae bacterium]|nr:response regulator [Polyangiaceae bacterium]